MSGNKTLYTTVKCRSMTTKEEFVEMWDKRSPRGIKYIIFDKGWIVATDYRINRNIVSLRFDSNVIAEIHVIKIIRIE